MSKVKASKEVNPDYLNFLTIDLPVEGLTPNYLEALRIDKSLRKTNVNRLSRVSRFGLVYLE